MSEKHQETIDIKKILIVVGVLGGFSLLISFVYYTQSDSQSPINLDLTPMFNEEENKPVESKSIFNPTTKTLKTIEEPVIDQKALAEAEKENQLRIENQKEQEFKNNEIKMNNEPILNQYVQYGIPRELIDKILSDDCSILNGTLKKIVDSAKINSNTVTENGTIISNYDQVYNGLLQMKVDACS